MKKKILHQLRGITRMTLCGRSLPGPGVHLAARAGQVTCATCIQVHNALELQGLKMVGALVRFHFGRKEGIACEED